MLIIMNVANPNKLWLSVEQKVSLDDTKGMSEIKHVKKKKKKKKSDDFVKHETSKTE